MKIVDGKGRLFGVINLVDLLAIVLLLCAIPVFVYAYKLVTLKSMVKTPSYVDVEKWARVTMRFYLSPELSAVIKEGDVDKNASNEITGRLIKILDKKNSDHIILFNASSIAVEHSPGYEINAVFDLLCQEKEGVLYYKGCFVKMGSTVAFFTDTYFICGWVTEFDPTKVELKK